MRRLRLGGQGVSLWTPPLYPSSSTPPKRDAITGWTRGAARRNRAFLMSVDPHGLESDLGFAATLTLGATPLNATIWAEIFHRFLVALRRLGAIRYHWVVEWTRRGRPHLHITFYLAGLEPITDKIDDFCFLSTPGDLKLMRLRAHGPWSFAHLGAVRSETSVKIIGPDCQYRLIGRGRAQCDHYTDMIVANAVFQTWRRAADPLPCHWKAQHVERIDGPSGWMLYVAKHCARGVDHYQRATAALPPGWTTSGRLWGKGGDWAVRADTLALDETSFYRLRRALRRWLRARAAFTVANSYGDRRRQALKELRYLRADPARRTTRDDDPRTLSSLFGLSSFAPRDLVDLLLIWAVDHPRAVLADLETGEVHSLGPHTDRATLASIAPPPLPRSQQRPSQPGATVQARGLD